MGLRFRKSFKVAPGLKLNLNKKSVSLTAGTRGAHYTINSKGKKTSSVGIPGTGISYTKTSSISSKNTASSNSSRSNNSGSKGLGMGCFSLFLGLMLLGLILALYSLAWIPALGIIIYTLCSKKYDKTRKLKQVGIFSLIFITSLILAFSVSGESQLISLKISLDNTEYDINEHVEVTLTPTPADATIDDLKISDSDIVILDYSDGKAIISFQACGTDTFKLTANDSVKSNAVTITVIDKEQEEADRIAAEEEAKRLAEEEAARIAAEEEAKRLEEEQAALIAAEEAKKQAEEKAAQQVAAQEKQEEMVWIPSSGSKYHSRSGCSGMKNPTQITLSDAKAKGYTACKRCH